MIYAIFTLQLLNINVYHNYLACVCICLVTQSCPTLVTPCTAALQAPLSMGILQVRIVEWVACPPPGDLPNPEIELRFLSLQVDSLPSESQGSPRIMKWVAYPFSRGLPKPGTEPGSPSLQVNSSSAELFPMPNYYAFQGGVFESDISIGTFSLS